MRKCHLILVFVCFLSCKSFAQRNNIWYFGKKAGISFNQAGNPSVPTSLPDGEIDSNEGCATICDENGNLLFYSDGITVYNRHHQVMLNGTGLMANSSTLQACIIVPLPGNNNLFYIFTTDAFENGFANGYRYSVVDMTRDNGNGEVLSKNLVLSASCTERMVAIRHRDGIGVWLVTNDNNSNVFRSWLITCNGINSSPVVSTVGAVLDQYALMNIGMMKASPDGKQICQTHYPFFDEDTHLPNFAQLFDFDNSTGILSNSRQVGFPDAQITTCEYSPNSKLLYLSRAYDRAIDQVEATLSTTAAILASRVTINSGDNFYGIQLAPDGKIYLAQPSIHLGAINQPDVKGLGCDFQREQFTLAYGIAYAGLPGYINDLSFNPVNTFTYNIIDSCTGAIQFNATSTMPGTISWQWNFGNGNTSNLQNPVHTFNPPGDEYLVSLEISSDLTCGSVKTAKLIKPRGIITALDFDFVSSCDSGYVRFINKNVLAQGSQYLWDFGDGQSSTALNPRHTYAQPGTYPVELKLVTNKACLDDSLTKNVTMARLQVTISDDQTIYTGQKIQLFVNGPGTIYQWTPSTGLSNPAVSKPQASPIQDIVYKAKVSNGNGCSGEDSVRITVVDLTDVYVPSAFTPNNDGRNDNIKPFFGTKFTLREFSIFNRWGERVFSTSTRGEGWNGRIGGLEQNTGVYIWILKYLDDKNNPVERKGSLVLLR